jgi:hypothetical protein
MVRTASPLGLCQASREATLTYYTGIDVSLEFSHFCVVDAAGSIVKEARIASNPKAIVAWFEGLRENASLSVLFEEVLRQPPPTNRTLGAHFKRPKIAARQASLDGWKWCRPTDGRSEADVIAGGSFF